jgi:hypothetical protein
MRRGQLFRTEPHGSTRELVEQAAEIAFPLDQAADLDPLMSRIGNPLCAFGRSLSRHFRILCLAHPDQSAAYLRKRLLVYCSRRKFA